jgi:hypothetical protein
MVGGGRKGREESTLHLSSSCASSFYHFTPTRSLHLSSSCVSSFYHFICTSSGHPVPTSGPNKGYLQSFFFLPFPSLPTIGLLHHSIPLPYHIFLIGLTKTLTNLTESCISSWPSTHGLFTALMMGDSTHLWNVGLLQWDYTVLYP